MTFISAPTYLNKVEYVCLLCLSRDSRHYLPFLTMSCNPSAAWFLGPMQAGAAT